MAAAGYNGWSNYETWCVKLWMDNCEGDYRYWTAEADEVWNDSEPDRILTKKERAALSLADRLKEYFEENNPLINDSGTVYGDLLTTALQEVDWQEIAENMLEEYEEEEAEEEVAE
jgi:hypothetical protein